MGGIVGDPHDWRQGIGGWGLWVRTRLWPWKRRMGWVEGGEGGIQDKAQGFGVRTGGL